MKLEETYKLKSIQMNEKNSGLIKEQSNQIKEMLNAISSNMSSKEEFNKFEKKSKLNFNILLSIVVLETISIFPLSNLISI